LARKVIELAGCGIDSFNQQLAFHNSDFRPLLGGVVSRACWGVFFLAHILEPQRSPLLITNVLDPEKNSYLEIFR
jgi:hypothetical protein